MSHFQESQYTQCMVPVGSGTNLAVVVLLSTIALGIALSLCASLLCLVIDAPISSLLCRTILTSCETAHATF